MLTPRKKTKASPQFFPLKEGVNCRCPYCAAIFAWPPEAMTCPVCGRAVRPPEGYAKPGREARRKAVGRIQKAADADRRKIGAMPVFETPKKPGFVLMLVVGLAVLGTAVISTSMKSSSVVKRSKKDPVQLTKSDIAVFAMALKHYEVDVGHYPSYRDGGLLALISDPGETDWYGPYINVIQNDGWRRPYHYDRTNGVPMLLSAGPDRRFLTDDDIVARPEDFTVNPEFIRHDPVRRIHRPMPSVNLDLEN